MSKQIKSDSISFDLLSEPWIPCERKDGEQVFVGIEQALVEAHTFSALHDESPLVTATLHRLLLAILQRAFAPSMLEDWLDLWEKPAFDAEVVRRYLEKYEDRFDLFHPNRPFLQVADLSDILGNSPEPTLAWRMALETSQHSNATQLFDPLPTEQNLSPHRAARTLLAFLGYTPGGRIQNEKDSWSAANLRGGAVVLVRGETFYRTLLLNLLWKRDRDKFDIPPWEQEKSTPRVTRAPRGLVDQLVWQSRRVQLLPESDEHGVIRVEHILSAAGERFDDDYPDPMFAYVTRDPKKPPMPVRIDPARATWRDSAALFDVATGSEHFRRPHACTQVAELVANGHIVRTARFHVELLGLASNKASIRSWRADRMPLPQTLLVDGDKLANLKEGLSLCEELGEALDRQILWILAENVLAPSDREAHKKDIQSLKDSLGTMESFWKRTGQAFLPWLEMVGDADLDTALVQWKRLLRTIARTVLNDTCTRLGVSARAFQSISKAQRRLERLLNEILGSNENAPNNLMEGISNEKLGAR